MTLNCPDIKSDQVRNQLCGLLYYPNRCENRCKHMYQRWLLEYEEVRRLEGKDTDLKSE
jgi:hypothetical protein